MTRYARPIVLLVIAARASTLCAEALPNDELPRIASAWADRARSIDSAKFELSVDRVQVFDGVPAEVRLSDVLQLRQQLLSHTSKRIGDDRRFPKFMRDVWEAEAVKHLGLGSSGDSKSGYTAPRKGRVGSRRLEILPVVWWARPAVEELGGYDPKNMTVVETDVPINGTPCCVVRVADAGGTGLLYLDKESYVVQRWTTVAGHWQMDIEYDKSADQKGAPKSWKIVTTNSVSKELLGTSTYRVDNCQINIPLDDSEFVLNFPENTLVHDEATGNESRVGAAAPSSPLGSLLAVLAAIAGVVLLVLGILSYKRHLKVDASRGKVT